MPNNRRPRRGAGAAAAAPEPEFYVDREKLERFISDLQRVCSGYVRA